MKKYLLVIALVAIVTTSKAQVRGVYYTPFVPKSSYQEPIRFPDFTPQPQSYSPSVTKTMDKVINSVALDLNQEIFVDVQVRIVQYSNGEETLSLVGLKNAEKWKPTNAQIYSLATLLSSMKEENEKSIILSLMEIADYMAQVDNSFFLLGLKQEE